MLSYFPMVYPEEILYSVIARYQRHTGLPPVTQTNEEVMGNRLVIPSLDLQAGITHLASLGVISKLPAEQILDEMTVFNYLVAYTSPKLAAQIRARVLEGHVRDWYLTLGYAAFRVDRLTVLRFCSVCNEEMLLKYGELYWHRFHQLPSVLVCPEHKVSLSLSNMNIRQAGRHRFIAADRDNCPPDAEPLIPENLQNEITLNRLHNLAVASLRLCDPFVQRRTLGGWTTYYRRRLEDVGLASKGGRVNIRDLHAGVRAYYGVVTDCLPGLHRNPSLRWLSKLARKQRSRSHPLQHLILDCYLDSLDRKPESLLGKGPWICRNPLARHYGKKTIRSYDTHRNHGHEVAVFRCSCGYVFTRSLNLLTGEVGLPRFQSYGALLAPALIALKEQGCSLRAISRELELDPKTVVRLASEIGVHNDWKTGTYIPKAVVTRVLHQAPKHKTIRSDRVSTIDWKLIDNSLYRSVKQAVKKILASDPPMKLTLAEIERCIDRQGWIARRLDKLPRSKNYLTKRLEIHEGFRERRIDWAISVLCQSGKPLFISTVLRKANLRCEAIPLVEAAIKRYQARESLQ